VTPFQNRRWALLLYLAVGAFATVQGFMTAVYFAVIDHESEAFLQAVMLLLSAALVLFGLYFFGHAFRRLADPELPIVIGPEGLYDRALSRKPIAWRDIRDLRVHRGARSGPHIGFDMDEAAATRADVLPRVRMAATINRLFGYGYRVHHMGTTANVDRLIAAMAPYIDVRR